MKNDKMQYLYWSLSRPMKYLGLTIDEWGLVLFLESLSFFCLNSGKIKIGLLLFFSGFLGCFFLKKYKKLSISFSLRSFLISKGFVIRPKDWPNSLRKGKIGR